MNSLGNLGSLGKTGILGKLGIILLLGRLGTSDSTMIILIFPYLLTNIHLQLPFFIQL
ncbi:hypothetical protein [Methanobacterium spitsbergense]|uniref:Uncharacterized protein n=1 Tax=Methanobacterium spitsbergense TaxID=2874285 RepID=A0A8T5UYV3_9EURY|nr:hypothetical protein [Methanobacterium spitsbergense]MBZ2167106.1 hypothetical protein [Methanobacterium spitsbergense]